MSRVNQIQQLVSQTNDLDSDIRFMALNDLNNLLSDPERASGFNHDNQSIVQIIQALLKLLKDPISEVKNQAIKCFVPLVQYTSDSHIQFIITKIRETTTSPQTNTSSEDQSEESIRFAALRSVIAHVPARSSIARLIAEELLPYQLKVPIMAESIDAVDIVMEIIKRFGSIFNETEINKVLKNLLETLTRSKKNVVKKRTTVALGLLARYLKGPELDTLMNYITESLSVTDATDDQLKHTILLTSIIARNEPMKFVNYFESVYPLIHQALNLDSLDADDSSERVELREAILIALESFVSIGYKVIEPVIPEIIALCAQFIKYDPNYIDNADDVDVYGEVDFSNILATTHVNTSDNIEEDDDDFDDEGFYSEFSDDEDLNWKLRRAAARLAATLTLKCPTQLCKIYTSLVPSLVLRASSEREESVRIEILNAFDAVINATDYNAIYYTQRASSNHRHRHHRVRQNSDASAMLTDSPNADTDPQSLLERIAARVALGAIEALQDEKVAFRVKQVYLANVLADLIRVLEGLVSAEITTPLIRVVCEVTKSNNSLLPDALAFVGAILRYDNSVSELGPMMPTLAQTILDGINDSYYKVTLSGIESSIALFDHLKSVATNPVSIPVDQFSKALGDKVQITAFDSEVRQQALVALGSLVASVPFDATTSVQISQIILNSLSNETLRLSAIKSIELIVNSDSICTVYDLEWISAVMAQLCVFLRQSSRVLRQACLSTLKLIAIKIYQNPNEDSPIPFKDLSSSLLLAAVNLDDAQLQSLVLDILALLYRDIWRNSLEEGERVCDYATRLVYDESSCAVEKSLIALIESLTSVYEPQQLYKQLVSTGHATDGIAAEAIAVVVVRGGLTEITKHHIAQISNVAIDDQTVRGSLYILGSIGRRMPLSISLETLYAKFTSVTESVRLAAARAIGGIASGNYKMYILTVLNHLTQVGGDIDNERVYLNLVSAHEILVKIHDSPDTKSDEFLPYAPQLWETLFFIETNDEASRDLTAECVGKLALAYPDLFLPLLKRNLSSPSVTTRLVVISAIKYTLGQSQDAKYDNLLQPLVADFLSLVEDDNVEIRQIAFSAIMSAVHHKSRLLLPQMSRLLPLLYQGTTIDTSLIKTVQMGPFKHKVDGGLDLRKTVYETMFTLVSTLEPALFLQYIRPKEMTDRFIAGGLDDDHDIKVLACVTLPRLVALDIDVLAGDNIKLLTEKFRTQLTKTVKDNAIKQEFEKQSEIKKMISRCSMEIDQYVHGSAARADKGGLSDVEVGIWVEYFNEIRSKQLIDVVFD